MIQMYRSERPLRGFMSVGAPMPQGAAASHDHRDIVFGHVTSQITAADEIWRAAGSFTISGGIMGQGAA